MLAPEYLAGLPDRLVGLYAAVERDILADMARRIREYDFYIPAARHQRQRLRAMGLAEEEIEARLSALTGKSREELRRLMEQAAERSLSADAAVYAAAGLGGVDPLAAAGVRAALLSGLAQTGGVFENLTRTTAHTAAKQFTDALDRVWLQIASGGFSYDTAIRNAVKDLARQGVVSATYPSGHTDTLEVAVRRAVVTGCNQTAAKAQIALMDELGTDLVETTAHQGARPSHQIWQGRVFSLRGRTAKYENFYEATGYGTGPGLCGWNCRHSFGPYIEGAPRAYSPALLGRYAKQTVTYNGKDLTLYEAGQQQRYIERQIRRWKREYAAMDGAGLDTGGAVAKISAWREREKDFCQQTGLKRQGERAQIAGQAKGIAKRAKRDILNDTRYVGIPVTDEAIQRVPLLCPNGWNQEWAVSLQEAHRELLKVVQGRPVGTEAGAVFTLDMRLIERRIGENAAQRLVMPRHTEPHIFIHNHPSGLTFSAGDIENFGVNGGLELLTAVGNNGAVYVLQKTARYDAAGFSKSFLMESTKLQQMETPQEYADEIERFLKEAEQYGLRFITGG